MNDDILNLISHFQGNGDAEALAVAYSVSEAYAHPYYQFQPRPDKTGPEAPDQQTSFIEAGRQWPGISCVVAGNSSGKTHCGTWRAAHFVLSTPPPEDRCPFWIASQTAEMTGNNLWSQNLKNWIPPDCIEAIAYANRVKDWPALVILKPSSNGNRWILTFKSYEQGREAFQGASIGGFMLDEQCPRDIFAEVVTRMRKWRLPGSQIYTLTPIEPDEDLENKFLNQEQFPSWKFFRFNTNEAARAGHVSDDQVKAMLENELQELHATRMTGAFAVYEGQIYPQFSTRHVIPPMKIPDNWIHCRGLDLGWSDETFCVYGARNEQGQWIIYREYVATRRLIRQHVEELDACWRYDHPSFGTTWLDYDAQDYQEYQDRGMKNVRPAWKESVKTGISIVQHMLRDDKILILNTCPRLIQALKSYVWDKKKRDEPKHDTASHGADSLRYLLASEHMSQLGLVKLKCEFCKKSILGGRYCSECMNTGARNDPYKSRERMGWQSKF